jgi:hypothetical protein
MGVILIARPAFIFGAQHGKVEEGATATQRFTAVCVALFGVLGGTGACTYWSFHVRHDPAHD